MLIRCVAALLIASSCFADDSSEPPLLFEIHIGDEKVSLVEGSSSTVTGLFDKAKVSVNVLPFRKFSKSGVSFVYPRRYVYEADVSDPEFNSWTVEGSNVVIMLFVVDGEYSASDYAEEMAEQFEDDAEVTKPRSSVKLGSRTYQGLVVELTLGGQRLSQAAYEVPLRGNRTGLLVLQDSLSDDGSHSKEWGSTMKLLSQSFSQK